MKNLNHVLGGITSQEKPRTISRSFLPLKLYFSIHLAANSNANLFQETDLKSEMHPATSYQRDQQLKYNEDCIFYVQVGYFTHLTTLWASSSSVEQLPSTRFLSDTFHA